jgi:hypothetical protein
VFWEGKHQKAKAVRGLHGTRNWSLHGSTFKLLLTLLCLIKVNPKKPELSEGFVVREIDCFIHVNPILSYIGEYSASLSEKLVASWLRFSF